MKLKETQIITFTNLKGGVGKTTTTANVGAAFARMGYKVLLVDWDPQGNLSKYFGVQGEDIITFYDAMDLDDENYFHRDKILTYPIEHYPDKLFIAPTNYKLAKFDALFKQSDVVGGEFILEEIVNEFVDDFDFILIDTNPSLSLLTINGYYASDHLIIPVEAGSFSVDGLEKILDVQKRAKKAYKRDINIAGVLFSRTKANTVLTKDYFREFKDRNDVSTFDSVVRDYTPIAESVEYAMDIFTYDNYLNEELPEEKRQQTNGVEDFYNLANEILYTIGINKSFESSRELEDSKEPELDVVKKSLTKKKGSLKSDFQNFLKQQ